MSMSSTMTAGTVDEGERDRHRGRERGRERERETERGRERGKAEVRTTSECV